ncbi:MAG TPA: ABC transporter permease, partial [Puia sp.]|nr:ABC transporter permease [Puia sp.]
MGKKYFIPALRHLWRYRLFTMLNILGMAISISACWIIFRIADYELGYDRGLPNGERIYRVVTGFKFDEKESYNGGVSAPIYQEVRKELNGLDYVVPVFENRSDAVEVNASSVKRPVFNDPSGIVSTDSSYFTMLPYRWVVGDKSTALNAPENVVLTETRAKKYFPGKKPEEIINSRLTYYSSDTVQRTITGIVSDLKAPTEFTAQEFCSLPTKAYALNEWTNTNGSDKLYLQLKRESKPDKILSQIENIVSRKQKEFEEKNANDFKFTRWYKLMPVKESHFSTYIHEYQVRKASKPVLYGLMGIGVFLLMLACINYVNMSIASMPQRAKEIGVRKTLGSSHAQLIFQFLSETLLTIFLGAIFADALSLFGFWILKDIIPPGVARLGESMQAAAFIFAVSIVVTVLAGFYPGWIITKVKTINVFRNFTVIKNYNQKFNLQKALIVFQFVIALVFITSAFIVGNQLHYALATDMGFDKDGVILVQVPWKYLSDIKYRDKQFTLFDELKKVSGIQGVSLGSPPMSEGYSSSAYEYAREGKEPISKQVFKKWVDTAYLNLYGMKLLA